MHCTEVLTTQVNHFASLTKWLRFRLQTKWLWFWILLLSPKLQIWSLLRARSSLTFRQTIECGVTLKLVRDMLITCSYFLLLCSLYASVWLCFRHHKFKTFLVLDLMISGFVKFVFICNKFKDKIPQSYGDSSSVLQKKTSSLTYNRRLKKLPI